MARLANRPENGQAHRRPAGDTLTRDWPFCVTLAILCHSGLIEPNRLLPPDCTVIAVLIVASVRIVASVPIVASIIIEAYVPIEASIPIVASVLTFDSVQIVASVLMVAMN